MTIQKKTGLVAAGRTRYIQCREHEPNLQIMLKPTEKNLEYTDSLEDKYYLLQTDELGFIKPSKYDVNDKVFFLGGSTTECIYVDEDKRWPSLISSILEHKLEGKQIGTYNCGVWGNTIPLSTNVLLNKVLPLKPTVCVLMHNINDMVLMIHEKNYWEAKVPSRRLTAPLVNKESTPSKEMSKSFLQKMGKLVSQDKKVHKAKTEWTTTDSEKGFWEPKVMKVMFERALATFVAVCKANNIVPVMMTQANRFAMVPDKIIESHLEAMLVSLSISYTEFKEVYDLFNQTIRDIAYRESIECIDLAKDIPQDKKYMYDSVHFNNTGSEYVAEYISNEMFNRNIVS